MKEISEEEMLKKIKETLEYLENSHVEIIGTKTKPYYYYCNDNLYKKIKELLPLDENDMYCDYGAWVKVINVDKPFEVEVKPYEPEFNNTNHKPFYRDVFKQNNSAYAVKVLGKWKKNDV